MGRLPEALFGLLLRSFPTEFRDRFGDGMRSTFRTRYRAERARGRVRLAVFLVRTTADVLLSGVRERLRPTRGRAEGRAGRAGAWDALRQDLRYGVRTLLRSRGFAAVAILTLALGIGGATAIFSVVDAVLLRPLPYADAGELVRIWEVGNDGARARPSEQNFRDVEERSASFEALAAYATGTVPVTVGARLSRQTVTEVSEGFFDVLGTEPELGRSIAPEELATGAGVVVVSDRFWRDELGGVADLSDATIRIGERVHAVVGVLPPGLELPWESVAWLPRDPRVQGTRTAHNWDVLGRLRPGVSAASAREEVGAIAADLKREWGDDTWMVDASVVPLQESLVGWVRPTLLILMGAAALLLVVACANVANLLLARASARRGELAVRRAVGAGTGRLVKQALTEALLLTVLGGVLGVLLAHVGVDALLALEPGRLPRAEGVGVNGWVLAFATAVSSAVTVGLGLLVAARAASTDVGAALAESGRSRGHARGRHRVRGALTSLQVATTLVLLVGASLLGRSFLELIRVDPGFRTSGAVVVDAYPPSAGDGFAFSTSGDAALLELGRTVRALVEGMRSLEGVSSVGVTNVFPLSGGGADGSFLVVERPDEARTFDDFRRLASDRSRLGYADYRVASAGYFDAMGIRLLRGRMVDDRDGPLDPHEAVVSETLASRKWPAGDAIGKYVQYANMDGDVHAYTIVGVVSDVRERGLDDEPRPTFYGNAMQRAAALRSGFSLVVATEGEPGRLAPAVQATVRSLAPDIPVRTRSLDEIFSRSLAQRRFSLVLLGVFALMSVVLALVGIHGVVSYLTQQRRREWAIRMALGASRGAVLTRVMAGGAGLAVVGVAIGVAAAVAATRLLGTLLFGVTPTDAPTFVGVAALLLLASLAASWGPAARATRTDPLVVLRE